MEKITLKGLPVQVVDSLPAVGSKAPALLGVDPKLKERSLSEFKERKKIICFVPSLDTPVCSLSAQKFNAHDIAVIYCSMDLPFALGRICEHLSHVTPLSLFRAPQIAKAFGVFQNDGPLKGLCARAVFVLDEEETVLYRELVKELTHEPDYDKALSYL